ncbi:MAG: thrombospondin type 3 repeat-containing protein [Flavobacteriaceae bacterium]
MSRIVFVFVLTGLLNSALSAQEIPVAFHILRDDNGNGARANTAQVDNEITILNDAYNYLNISFVKCSENYIDDSTIWNQFEASDADKLLLDPYSHKNVVNVFITDLRSGLNGKAVFPYKQKDWVLIDYTRLATSTLIHEFGHYFGLHHTYSGVDGDNPASQTSLTISDAEGPEGWRYGDYLIDTPLDPEKRSDYDSNCVYTGNQLDANGDAFHPDGKNYMGKGHSTCRSKFSPGQGKRMLEYIKRYRYYLSCGSTADYTLSCANSSSVSTFPHIDDFEREDIDTYWVQSRYGDDLNWRNGPSTSSENTGPNEAHSGQTFLYLEASLKYTAADEALLLSPCYDFTGSAHANITFYYHMYGSGTGTLKLEVSTDDGATWSELFSVSGEQHGSGSDEWTKKAITLDWYAGGNAQFRFKAISTGSSKGDISIDKVTVHNVPLDSDADGIHDGIDNCPETSNAGQEDNDLDDLGDVCDEDDDNDGVPDTEDAFPFDSSESVDTDNDGVGNNADTDDDNDGVMDVDDDCPILAGNINGCPDSDTDGVTDNNDLYPNTPEGASVDSNGGVIVDPMAISILGKTPTCPEKNNGQIHVLVADYDYSFDVQISGPNGYNHSVNGVQLSNQMMVPNLAPGKYHITLAFSEQLGANIEGYVVTIHNPKILSKSSKVNLPLKKVRYLVSGSTDYFVYRNGRFMFDIRNVSMGREQEITVQLAKGANHVKIIGKNDCQGQIEEWIEVDGTVRYSPNPTQNWVSIWGLRSDSVVIRAMDVSGNKVLQEEFLVASGTVGFSLEHFPAGVYIVNIKGSKEHTNIKIIKR